MRSQFHTIRDTQDHVTPLFSSYIQDKQMPSYNQKLLQLYENWIYSVYIISPLSPYRQIHVEANFNQKLLHDHEIRCKEFDDSYLTWYISQCDSLGNRSSYATVHL